MSDGLKLLTVPEACAELRISRWALYQLIRRRQLRTITIGKRRLVPLVDIYAYVEGRRQTEAAS